MTSNEGPDYVTKQFKVEKVHMSTPETKIMTIPESPETSNQLIEPAIMLQELKKLTDPENLPANIKDREAVIEASKIFRGTLNVVTNEDFMNRVLIGMDPTFRNDGDLKNTTDPKEAFSRFANMHHGRRYREFLDNRTLVAGGLVKLAQEMQKHPDDPRYAQMFQEIVKMSVNVADQTDMQSYNDRNLKSDELIQKLNVLGTTPDGKNVVTLFTREELSDIRSGTRGTSLYFSEGFEKGKHKEAGHFDVHTNTETVTVHRFEKVEKEGWKPSLADVDLYKDDPRNKSKLWMAEAYNRWYELRAKESISGVRKEEDQREAQGLKTHGSSNEFILKTTVENDATALLENLDKLPPELFELFVVDGKKPEDLTSEELNEVMNLLKGYNKDWSYTLENIGDQGETQLKIEAIGKWSDPNGGWVYDSSKIPPSVESGFKYNGELPQLLMEKAKRNPDWKTGSRHSKTASGLDIYNGQAVRTIKKDSRVAAVA